MPDTITEGIAGILCIQAETTFNAVSAATIYFVPGKIQFNFQPVLAGGGAIRDVWRNQVAQTFAIRHYTGSITFEVGMNLATKLALAAFLELKSSATASGITTYIFRPRRTVTFGSLKFGLEYSSGQYYVLHGAVIDKLEWSVGLRLIPQLKITFKCARRETGTQMSGSAQTIAVNGSDHVNSIFEINDVAQSHLQEFSFQVMDTKLPARFDDTGAPTRFAAGGDFNLAGSAMELFNTASTIQDNVNAMTAIKVRSRISSRDNALRYFEILWPRCRVLSGTPEGVSKSDVVNRYTFAGEQDSALDTGNEPLITIAA
jgi:hypothetical protein